MTLVTRLLRQPGLLYYCVLLTKHNEGLESWRHMMLPFCKTCKLRLRYEETLYVKFINTILYSCSGGNQSRLVQVHQSLRRGWWIKKKKIKRVYKCLFLSPPPQIEKVLAYADSCGFLSKTYDAGRWPPRWQKYWFWLMNCWGPGSRLSVSYCLGPVVRLHIMVEII